MKLKYNSDSAKASYFEKLFSGEGITQFFHDHPDKQEIPNCDGKDCYNLTLVYDNTPQQIASIVERSRSCKQKFEVSGNFFKYGNI